LVTIAVALVLSSESSARAQVQVTDQFTHVAKELAKRFVSAELAAVCTTDRKYDAVCAQVMSGLTDAFVMALDGHVDSNRLAILLRSEFGRVVETTAMELGTAWVKELIDGVTSRAGECSLQGAAEPLAQCFVARLYKGALGSFENCRAAHATLEKAFAACGGTRDVTKVDTLDLVTDLADVLETKKSQATDSYAAIVILRQVARIAAHSDATAYGVVRAAAEAHEAFVEVLERPANTPDLFGKGNKDVEEVRAQAKNCPGGADVMKQVDTWDRVRASTFLAVSRAVARFQEPPTDINFLPEHLPDPRCASSSDPLVVAIDKIQKDARTFHVDVRIAAIGQDVILPAMLVAILVDYVRTQDDALLTESLSDFCLQVLARLIASAETGGEVTCNSAAGGGVSCAPVVGEARFSVQAPSADPQDLGLLLEARHSPSSARNTCLYQAAATLLSGKAPIGGLVPRACRTFGPSLADTIFAAHLTTVGPGLAQWEAGEVVPSVIAGEAKLRFASHLTPQQGFQMLGELLPRLEATSGPMTADLHAVVTALRSLALGLSAQGRAMLLRGASDTLRPQLRAFLDNHLASIGQCTGNEATGLRCGVRVLVEAAYDPVMSYVSAPGGTDADAKQLSNLVLVQLDKLDPLGRSPLLFNVGPGFTLLTRFGSDTATAHLTLLDKFGVARRWGDRRQFELGVFVGGFADAIIRAAAGATDAGPYWLAGLTVGDRQFSTTFPFGLEAHAALANPFDLAKYGDKVAAAAGLNFIVPVDIAFSQ
jgi:hypothetical protein